MPRVTFQVKRMLAHVGGHVGRLHRDRFGSLADPTLLPGAMRLLTREELHSLVSTLSKLVSSRC